jgi:hypothetical protein
MIPPSLFRRVARGDRQVSAATLNNLMGAIEHLGDFAAAGGAVEGGQYVLAADPPETFFAKITGSDGGTPPAYSWQLMLDLGGGLFIPDVSGWAGTYDSFPAYEWSGNAAVPTDGSAIVELIPSRGGENYYFSWPAAGAGGTAEGVWIFKTGTTMADPLTGNFHLNATTTSAVTAIAISSIDNGGTDTSRVLASLRAGDQLYLQDQANADNWARYEITDIPVDNSTWFELPVAYVGSAGTPIGNNSPVGVVFHRSGGAGATVPDASLTVAGKVNLLDQDLGKGNKSFHGNVCLFQLDFAANDWYFKACLEQHDRPSPVVPEGTPDARLYGADMTLSQYGTGSELPPATLQRQILLGRWGVYDGLTPIEEHPPVNYDILALSGPNPAFMLIDTTAPATTHLGGSITTGGLTFKGGLYISGTATGGAGGGHTIMDEGTPFSPRSNLNFTGAGVTVTDDLANDRTNISIPGGGGGITDGTYGDIVVSGGGTVWNVGANTVGNAELRDSAGLSVLGRATAGLGDPEDIVAVTAGHCLRLAGGVLGFGLISLPVSTTGTLTVSRGGTDITSYAKGDMLYASDPDLLSKLAIGTTDGHVLTVASGVPVWAAPAGGGGTVTSVTAGTGLTGTPNPIVGSGTIALTVPVAVANGGTGATTAPAALTALGGQPLDADLTAIAALTGTDTIYYRSAVSTWTAVAVGTGLSFTGGSLTNADRGSTAVATHEGLGDPHPQYLTQAEGDTRYPLASAPDPYPQYLTAAEAGAAYQPIGNYAPTSRTVSTAAPLSGGGDLSADRTLAVSDFTSGARGTVPASGGGTANFLRADGAWAPPGGGGTVTSITMSAAGTGLTFTPATITTSGTFALSGTLDADNGGTGLAAYAAGDLLYAPAANTLAARNIGSVGQKLEASGSPLLPAWKGAAGCTVKIVPPQGIKYSEIVVVDFLAEVYDPDGWHEGVTNPDRITVPVAGAYLVFHYMRWQGSAIGFRSCFPQVNGQVAGPVHGTPTTGDPAGQSTLCCVLALNAGDYVQMAVLHTSTEFAATTPPYKLDLLDAWLAVWRIP